MQLCCIQVDESGIDRQDESDAGAFYEIRRSERVLSFGHMVNQLTIAIGHQDHRTYWNIPIRVH